MAAATSPTTPRAPRRSTITLDDQADDGELGEGDLVATSIEGVIGGAGGDKITGGAAHEQLFGEGGDDTIRGGDGNDTISGGEGKDRLWGNNGVDSVDGGNGNDRLDGRDATTETLRCGAGKDEAWADKADKPVNCEKTHTTKAKSAGQEAAPVAVETVTATATVRGVSKVTSKGRFVGIPGFPGERIDRRLLADIALPRGQVQDPHHRRLRDGGPRRRRRAPDRPRASTSSPARAARGTTSTGSPSGPSPSRTARARRSAGSATTATPTTAAATTCT